MTPEEPQSLTPDAIRDACLLSRGRRSFLGMMQYCWQSPDEPLLIGHHTKIIADRIDQAKRDYLEGKSTRLIITLPYRHGKSDMSSRYLPADLLGWNPDFEIILGSYGSDLSQDFSRDVKGIVTDAAFQRLYPEFPGLDPQADSIKQRRVAGRKGKINAVGMSGGATGKGSNALILDDTLKNREEAESLTVRESRWNSFRSDFFTRLAPVYICIIVQTRWHVFDTIGRIKMANDPEHKDYDPTFPKFDVIHFRAKSDENIQHTGCQYLFPARFGNEWYEAQFGIQGAYGAASLLQGEPFIEGGNLLQTGNINFLDTGEDWPEWMRADCLAWVRAWDLAYTEKQRAKSDPDYTFGLRVAVIEKEGRPDIMLIDAPRYCQKDAGPRDRMIRKVAKDEDEGIPQYIEANGTQRAAYTTMRDILKGIRSVNPFYPQGDKVVRAQGMEPIFEAGNVWIRCSQTDQTIILVHMSSFPTPGVHDDAVDAASTGYSCAKERNKLLRGKSVSGKVSRAAC